MAAETGLSRGPFSSATAKGVSTPETTRRLPVPLPPPQTGAPQTISQRAWEESSQNPRRVTSWVVWVGGATSPVVASGLSSAGLNPARSPGSGCPPLTYPRSWQVSLGPSGLPPQVETVPKAIADVLSQNIQTLLQFFSLSPGWNSGQRSCGPVGQRQLLLLSLRAERAGEGGSPGRRFRGGGCGGILGVGPSSRSRFCWMRGCSTWA